MLHDLKTLILSFHPVIAIETVEEERVSQLLASAAADLRLTVFDWSLTRGLIREDGTGPMHGTAEPLGLMRHLEGLTVNALFHLKDFTGHLSDPPVARKFREVAQRFTNNTSAIVLTGPSIDLPADIDHKVVHFGMRLPNRDEIRIAIKPVLRSLATRQSVEVAYTEPEFEQILDSLTGMTINQARQAVAYSGLIDGRLGADDVAVITERKAQVIRDGGLLEYFPTGDNQSELGGFDRLKEWLARARVGFSEEAKLLNLQPPRGILIVGVQGCGKSLAAKAIAREWQLPLLKLDAGRLYDKFIGETEKNFRKAITLAESLAPAVLWFDEIEKAINQSGGDNDGGVSKRVFGSFLTWLQEKRAGVFVVATANDLSSLPPELLRKGRFDEIFFVDLPDEAERAKIFSIHLELRKQEPRRFRHRAFSRGNERVQWRRNRAGRNRRPLPGPPHTAETRHGTTVGRNRRNGAALRFAPGGHRRDPSAGKRKIRPRTLIGACHETRQKRIAHALGQNARCRQTLLANLWTTSTLPHHPFRPPARLTAGARSAVKGPHRQRDFFPTPLTRTESNMTATSVDTWIASVPPLEVHEVAASSEHRRDKCVECLQGVPCLHSFETSRSQLRVQGH